MKTTLKSLLIGVILLMCLGQNSLFCADKPCKRKCEGSSPTLPRTRRSSTFSVAEKQSLEQRLALVEDQVAYLKRANEEVEGEQQITIANIQILLALAKDTHNFNMILARENQTLALLNRTLNMENTRLKMDASSRRSSDLSQSFVTILSPAVDVYK